MNDGENGSKSTRGRSLRLKIIAGVDQQFIFQPHLTKPPIPSPIYRQAFTFAAEIGILSCLM